MTEIDRIYFCKACNFTTNNKYDFKRHNQTKKHILKNNKNNITNVKKPRAVEKKNKTELFICLNCSREYKYKSGLSRHEKKCWNNLEDNQEIIGDSEFKEQLKQQQQQILNLHTLLEKSIEHNNILTSKLETPNVTNINNNLTLNLFLNHECKDAMNITDFLETVNLSIDDLNYTRENGYIKGITNIFLKNLSILPPMSRPIHCCDLKKLQFYVKDQNKWEKDMNNDKIDKSIEDITKLQINKIKEWHDNHPDWDKSDDGTTQYISMVKNIMGGVNENDSTKNLEIIKKEIGESININEILKK